jgi:hypothetical protein
MAEDKKPKDKKVESKPTLQQQLDSITFKNEQAQKIIALQKDEQRLKDNLGRNKARRISSAGRIAGLQTLGNSFGK